ncbi:MAG: Abi family protein [Firmicutes bacterium]|nr:Abi family protein [Bacillota bacterium]MBQ6012564.1 Abi family protein [Bacillota bacterium]MBQ6260314.1 Abi family protein [Bacillota bacterium]
MNTDISSTEFKLCKGDTKPFLSVDQQLDLLKSRGLIVRDDENAKDILRRTNYYRLSGYSLTLRENDMFHDGVSFDDLYEIYRFDDGFRRIILTYSSNVEVAFRSFVAYNHARNYGPLGYMDADNFENSNYHKTFIAKITEEVSRSDDIFVYHHRKDLNCVFPIWAVIECSSFGDLSKLYKNLKAEDRTFISKNEYGVSREYIENWLQAIVSARNIAAHAGRFYNRRFKSVRVKLPKKLKRVIWSDSAFAIVYAIHRLQPTEALAKALRKDLSDLISKYPIADKAQLGICDDWEDLLISNTTKYQLGTRNKKTDPRSKGF